MFLLCRFGMTSVWPSTADGRAMNANVYSSSATFALGKAPQTIWQKMHSGVASCALKRARSWRRPQPYLSAHRGAATHSQRSVGSVDLRLRIRSDVRLL